MSFNYVFFNGDVRKDKRQEAMLRTLNERDNFLNRLKEMEQKREREEKQEKAARKIQKIWKGYRARQIQRVLLRADFDGISNRGINDVIKMSQLLVNFYESDKDEERLVITLVELVKARTADRTFEQKIRDTQRVLLARCCIKFLHHATENSVFFHIFRYLEDYVTCHSNLFEIAAQLGLYEAEFHLLEALIGIPEHRSIQKASLNPRLHQLLGRIFETFVNPSRSTAVSVNVADRLLKTLCVNISDLNFSNYAFHYIKDHIRPCSPNYYALFEAMKSADIVNKWKVRPQLVEAASIRLRAIMISQIELANKSSAEDIRQLFDSLAQFLEKHGKFMMNLNVKEDLSDLGRLRTAVNNYLWNYCEEMLTSCEFRRAGCIYVNLSNINVESVVSLKKYFNRFLDLLASSNTFVEALYVFIVAHCKNGEFEVGDGKSPKINALELFCNCLNKRVSSVADSDFVPNDIFVDFDRTVEFLRDVSIKLINLMFPTIPNGSAPADEVRKRIESSEATWKDVTDSVFSILAAIYQKDIRLKYFPEGFWTNHGRQVLSGIGDHRMPRRRLPNGRMTTERTMHSEFVERLSAIYEMDDSDSENEDEAEDKYLPAVLRKAICIMKHIPFIVPFMDRVQLFNRLLTQLRDKNVPFDRFVSTGVLVTVRRDQVYMDAFEQFGPKMHGDRVNDLRSMVRVKMVNWAGMDESGVDGGGIFREFLSELLKTAFNVERGFFTLTENKLLYPNPTAPFLLGASCHAHFQFIGRMIGKLIYERQLQDVRFAEFFIAQIFETNKNKDIDLQHMKSFDPLIFKHLKALQKMNDHELDELQLDFSVVTSDVGLVRSVNLKPNGSNCRVTVENVHEYLRLYVNYQLKLRISTMVDAIRKGISEIISIEWMRMFAPHELQILIAGYEEAFTAKELRKYCELRFANVGMQDSQFEEMFWDVVDKLSSDDKKSLLKFVTGCSRAPVDGFKSVFPKMGVLVLPSSDEELPTSATCMNMLRIPKYSNRTKLEEKLRYAINSGAGFELN